MIYQLILNGLVQGSLLALICIGYSLAYGSARVLNFAHADVMISGGGYLVLYLISDKSGDFSLIGMPILFGISGGIAGSATLQGWELRRFKNAVLSMVFGATLAAALYIMQGDLSFGFAVIVAVPFTGLLAVAIYQAAYLPLMRKDAPRNTILLSSFGMSIILQSLLLCMWGSERRVFPPIKLPQIFVIHPLGDNQGLFSSVFENGLVQLSPMITFPVRDIIIVVVFCIIAMSLSMFFRRSKIADAIIAAGDSPLAARACGIPIERIYALTFFIGGAVATLGGAFYILRTASLDPMSGFTPGILAFVACVLGGIGSLRGSILGALSIGMINSVAPSIPSAEWAADYLPRSWLLYLPSFKLGDWSYGVAYVLMILTILIRPKGLFSK